MRPSCCVWALRINWVKGPARSLHSTCCAKPHRARARKRHTAYVAGERARRLAAMSADERLLFTLRQMEQIFPAIRENYEGGASVCWDQDEWARGAYAWFKPGQMTSLLPHIASAEGRIHFAG